MPREPVGDIRWGVQSGYVEREVEEPGGGGVRTAPSGAGGECEVWEWYVAGTKYREDVGVEKRWKVVEEVERGWG